MGNTLSTTASTEPAPSSYSAHFHTDTKTSISKRNPHQPDSRPSTAGFSPSAYSSLRKTESSSTLSSSVRFYNHPSLSNVSMSSKVSKSSARRKQTSPTDKVLDIGKPTQFEHGIHVEYNKNNGRFMVKNIMLDLEGRDDHGLIWGGVEPTIGPSRCMAAILIT